MEKVKNFLKDHNLGEELLSDKKFIEDSKKIFEEQGLEFSEEQLREIIGDVSENLEDVKELPQNDLEVIAGGVLKEDDDKKLVKPYKSASKSRVAVQATGAILGILVGGGLGLGLSSEFKYSNKDHKMESTKFKTFPTVVGAGVGSIIGFKLGKLIADKYEL